MRRSLSASMTEKPHRADGMFFHMKAIFDHHCT